MKKFFIISVMIFLNLMVVKVSAEGAPIIQMKANEEGKVIVDTQKSIDGNEYILNEVEPEEEFNIMRSSATTFSTFNYINGFFDNPSTTYSVGNQIALQMVDNKFEEKNAYSLGQNARIYLDNPIKINAFFIAGEGVTTSLYYQGKKVYSKTANSKTGSYLTFDPITIDEIHFEWANSFYYTISEIEIFEQEQINYESVSNLRLENVRDTEAKIKFSNPESPYFTRNEIFVNEIKQTNYDGVAAYYELSNLTIKTNYDVMVRSYYSDGVYVDAITTFTTKYDITPTAEVKNVNIQQSKKDVILTYTFPTDIDFSHVKIFRNNVLIAENVKAETYTDNNANVGNNTYRIVSVDMNGNESGGVTKVFKVSSLEVSNLKAVASEATKVELTWTNPTLNDFEMVKIYRQNKSTGILARTLSFFALNDDDDDFSPIFETNGTVFRDLTVTENTTYEYKLTTKVSGEETTGITAVVTTPSLKVKGPVIDKTSEGDYLLKWESPITGKVKIIIDGEEFAIVNAADQKILIPSEKIVKDIFGGVRKDLIKVVAISEDGKESVATTPTAPKDGGAEGTEGTIDDIKKEKVFDAMELLKMGVGILGVVGVFVLLGLAFPLAKRLIDFLRKKVIANAKYRKV